MDAGEFCGSSLDLTYPRHSSTIPHQQLTKELRDIGMQHQCCRMVSKLPKRDRKQRVVLEAEVME